MAWCHQATSHYLSQCWPRFMSPYGVVRPQWVNSTNAALLSIWPPGMNFSQMRIILEQFTSMEKHFKILSAKYQPFCSGFIMRHKVGTPDKQWSGNIITMVADVPAPSFLMPNRPKAISNHYADWIMTILSHESSGWETSTRPLANASENLAGRVENRVSGILYMLYKRLPSSGECQKILVSQPESYCKIQLSCYSHQTNNVWERMGGKFLHYWQVRLLTAITQYVIQVSWWQPLPRTMANLINSLPGN